MFLDKYMTVFEITTFFEILNVLFSPFTVISSIANFHWKYVIMFDTQTRFSASKFWIYQLKRFVLGHLAQSKSMPVSLTNVDVNSLPENNTKHFCLVIPFFSQNLSCLGTFYWPHLFGSTIWLFAELPASKQSHELWYQISE